MSAGSRSIRARFGRATCSSRYVASDSTATRMSSRPRERERSARSSAIRRWHASAGARIDAADRRARHGRRASAAREPRAARFGRGGRRRDGERRQVDDEGNHGRLSVGEVQGLSQQGQFEQSHRLAALAAGVESEAGHRRARAGHEPFRRDQRAGQACRAGGARLDQRRSGASRVLRHG